MTKDNADYGLYVHYVRSAIPKCHGYQELHAHSEASFRDAVNKVDDFVETAKGYGRQAFAITDHGNQMRLYQGIKARTKDEKKNLEAVLQEANVPEDEIHKILKSIGDTDSIRYPTDKMWPYVKKYCKLFLKAAEKSIQFVPGMEAYFQPEKVEGNRDSFHLILYAKDWNGQKTLFKLENLAQLNKSPKGKWNGQETGGLPRMTWADLERFVGPGTEGHGHLIATSACVGGYIPYLILRPWYIADKQHAISMALAKLGDAYTEEDVKQAEQDLVDAKEKAAKAKADLRDLKKLSGKDHEKKKAQLEKKIEKLKAVVGDFEDGTEQSAVLDENIDENDKNAKKRADLKKAVITLRAVIEEQEKAEQLIAREAEIKAEAEQAPKRLACAKERLAEVEKGARPYIKQMGKYRALEAEKVDSEQAYQDAVTAAKRMESIFGHENFYIELQNHGIASEDYARPYLYRLIKETGIEPTVANDVHFKTKDDVRKRNLIASLRFNTPLAEKETEEGLTELYFKSDEEMKALAKPDDAIWQRGMENTAVIAKSCNVYYSYGMHLPEFDAHAAGCETALEYLDKFCRKMIPQKYPKRDMPDDKYAELMKTVDERLKYELSVIEKMGYSSYIAIVQDFIFYGRKIGGEAAIGPGRGSAAGSIVCYLADITDIDPLRYDLIFERFLNPERVSMPDIDTDLAPFVRGKVINYVANKYAYKDPYPVDELRSTVCNIVTEGKLAAKAAVRNVARITDVPLDTADMVAKMIPAKPKMTIKKAMEENPDLATQYKNNLTVKHLLDDAMLVEGIPVQTGVHAAGVIIADKPVSEYAPLLWNDEKNCWVIESDMVECEKTLGLLKMDFLGLENLDILNLALKYIKTTKKVAVHFHDINKADDLNVIRDIYACGRTNGVFQFESDGIKKALTGFNPTSIDDVILMNAAYRPGPMDSIPEITEVKNGTEKPNYIIPQMEQILGKTYGSAIYQEQIMQLFQLVGFSLGEADVIRRAMSKKHLDEIEAAKDKFVSGMIEQGGKPADVEKFWIRLLAFASYAFNKSHAAAYSIVSYYTAFLKYYFPCEYLSAQLSYTPEKLKLFLSDLKYAGLTLLQPDINSGVPNFAPMPGNNKQIRFGIKAIKGVSAAAQIIYDLRDTKKSNPNAHHLGPCKDYKDFIVRSIVYGVDMGVCTALVRAGALDCLMQDGETRRQFDEALAPACESCKKAMKSAIKEDETLAGDNLYRHLMDSWGLPDECIQQKEEYDIDTKLGYELELLGAYVSGTPVQPYLSVITKSANRDRAIGELTLNDRGRTDIAGRIRDFKIIYRKSDHAPMAKFMLDDETDSISCVAFTGAYATFGYLLKDGAVVSLSGTPKFETNDDGDTIVRKEYRVKTVKNLLAE